jgi:hypothetical protein
MDDCEENSKFGQSHELLGQFVHGCEVDAPGVRLKTLYYARISVISCPTVRLR